MKGTGMFQRACYKSGKYLKNHSPTILSFIGAIGVIGTAVLAVKATPKAIKRLERAKNEKGEELTKFETVIVASPVYVPTTLIGISTIVCILGANALNKRQQASLVSAYALLEESYKEYIKCFNEQVLDKLDWFQVYEELHDLAATCGKPQYEIALICYEKSSDFCHRHLVSDWFNKNLVACKEWEDV